MLNHTEQPNKIERFFEVSASTVENIMLMLATRFGPWLAPVGPSFFVGRAAYTHLDAHIAIAVCMAAAVEAVGIAATHTALKAWAWNEARRKTDPEAPTALMIWLSLFYFAAALVLSILVEVYPASATYAPAVFIGLAAVAYVTIAVSLRLNQWQAARIAEHTDRQTVTGLKAEIAKQRAELTEIAEDLQRQAAERDGIADEVAKLKRRKAKADNAADGVSPLTNTSIETANQGRTIRIQERRQRIRAHITDGKTDAEIREIEGISQDTLRRDKATLQPVANGHGNGVYHLNGAGGAA